MINYVKHRAKLLEAIARRKKPETTIDDTTPTCQHTRKRYKQRIQRENAHFNHSDAYFILLACDKCKDKQIIDMVIE